MIAVLGAFDGFHRGHAYLFERAREAAASMGLEWGGVTFDPSPELYMGAIEKVLFTLRERELIRLFLGIPKLIALKFDSEFLRLSPERFWKHMRERVEVDGVVVGRDFRFGYRRTGDVSLLERYCREAGLFFLSTALLPRGVGAEKISSSAIRSEVEAGECELAAGSLGYPYFILAKVRHGLERGRKLGFPTANLDVPSTKLLPPEGVYATAVLVKGQWKAGALSIGRNPTFDDISGVSAEVFVLDYNGDLYGDVLPVFLLSRLRPQERFKDSPQLVRQIEADATRSKEAFKRGLETSQEDYRRFMEGYTLLMACKNE